MLNSALECAISEAKERAKEARYVEDDAAEEERRENVWSLCEELQTLRHNLNWIN